MPVTRSAVVSKGTPSRNPSTPFHDLESNYEMPRQTHSRTKSNKPSMPVQISQEVIEISSDDDDLPPSRRPKPHPGSSASDLRKEVTRLKDSNALLKSQVKNLQNEVDAQKDKVRSLERTARSDAITVNYSEVDDIISCSICAHPMLVPYLLGGCGHTFCQTCLSAWFDTTLRNFLVSHPHYSPAIAHLFPPKPEYTCPECRAPVTIRPVENFALKAFTMMSLAARQGHAVPTPARPRGSPWDGFFPQPRT